VKQTTHRHPVHEWMICHVDGLVTVDGRKLVWEAKHTNPFGSVDDILKSSYPKLQHNMMVTGLEGAMLSAFYGNLKWGHFVVERDADYMAQLLEREEAFWRLVESDTPPAGDVEAVRPDFNELKTADMRFNNMWCDSEATWLKYRTAVAASDSAESALKGMMEADVGFAFGPGVVVLRDRAGKLTMREPNRKDQLRISEFLGGEPL
jgi:hypothetical protein